MKEEDVVRYLEKTPDFFERNPSLLEGLTIPHPLHGGAISLLERQVSMLRKSTSDYRNQFERLVEVARENEGIMKKSRRLVVRCLSCESLDDFAAAVEDVMREEFSIDFLSLVLFSDTEFDSSIRTASWSSSEPILKEMLSHSGCYCGVLSVEESEFLFQEQSDAVMSSAILPLVSREGGQVVYHGVLALGSNRLRHFDKDKGSLFLDFLSDLLSALLLRLMP
ncbi:DUF484 domain-containing protein [Marinomonas piezotolerans]|uniref:DUF484 domain-containing protein n=1 Tax=Marinomonas piezotolerans TaxID=2213058 RepID=A0A370U4K5_9GAMM|nr:DUF484 family protein [Marinomonas piezotolerans]RDL42688.1 DUF484 domain-containing protein [Marinomonas piezotolerans]